MTPPSRLIYLPLRELAWWALALRKADTISPAIATAMRQAYERRLERCDRA